MSKVSYAILQKKYGGKYVLTDKPDGKIVAAHKKLSEAFKIAEKKGYSHPAVRHIAPTDRIAIYEASISLSD